MRAQNLPLSDITICDFTAVWAGQTVTMYLADLGANCIKVENPYIWNPMTRAASPRLDEKSANLIAPWMGGHPGSDPGPRPWNNSPAFIHVQRNKKSFTVDSRRPEGLEVVKNLIRKSNLIADNLALGTLARLGLSDDAIRAIRPDIVILHLPAFGLSGQYIEGRGYGAHIDAVAGSTILRGYADSSPVTNTQIFAGDYFAGLHGAVAALAALRHQRKTGQGQVIELAQLEASAQMFPQAAMDGAWNGRAASSIGNRSIEGFVPNGVFPCSGTDRWIAISCRDDAEWAALREFMDNPRWATDPELVTAGGRAAAEDEIEARLREFTANRDRDQLFRSLQEVGVTAGPVLNNADVCNDPHLAATGAFRPLPATEDYPAVEWLNPAYRFSESDVGIRSEPALFGQHNDYVYRELLGYNDAEVEEYRRLGHIADRYDDAVINA